jgi:hypothetical protein
VLDKYDDMPDDIELRAGFAKLSENLYIAYMGGEPCYEVKQKLEALFPGVTLLFFGYADSTAYIPDDKIIAEGGYEAEGSAVEYGHKGSLKSGVDGSPLSFRSIRRIIASFPLAIILQLTFALYAAFPSNVCQKPSTFSPTVATAAFSPVCMRKPYTTRLASDRKPPRNQTTAPVASIQSEPFHQIGLPPGSSIVSRYITPASNAYIHGRANDVPFCTTWLYDCQTPGLPAVTHI